jgi:hypothetical protein
MTNKYVIFYYDKSVPLWIIHGSILFRIYLPLYGPHYVYVCVFVCTNGLDPVMR